MMTHRQLFRSIIFAATLAAAGSAFGQSPTCAAPGCNSTTSDNYGNTASGTHALPAVEGTNGGIGNTADGNWALYFNTTGPANTAFGNSALVDNTTGIENTASGFKALFSNTTGAYNSASGGHALAFNTTGYDNVAGGYQALYSNTEGYNNTAIGMQVLYSNTTGDGNAGQGAFALEHNTTGNQNTALGNHALQFNNGSQNTVLGFEAGYLLTGGSNNIDIGSPGGAPTESNTIRIGTTATTVIGTALTPQTATYIAGIASSTLTGAAVYVTSSGQLGVLASSERYKTDITPLGTRTKKLQQLRPVSFRLKSDPSGTVQYGLIAEEVAKVYPELVVRGDDGRINGIRYEELAPMLLNEVQQQAAEIRELKQQQAEIDSLKHQYAELLELKLAMQMELAELRAGDTRVALR